MNLERCRKKLEQEAKHATVGIFGGKFGSADFRDAERAAEEVRVGGEWPRRSELGERMMERGGSGRSWGFLVFGDGAFGRQRQSLLGMDSV